MNKTLKKKIVAWLSLFLMLFQNALPLVVYAQDASPSPSPTADPSPSPELDPTPTPTPESSPTPTPEITPEPTPDTSPTPTPEPSIEPTPIATSSAEPTVTPTPNQNNDQPSNEQQSEDSSPAPPTEASPALTVSPSSSPSPEPENFNEQLQAVLLENSSAISVIDLDLKVTETGSAVLSTDKPDYAPTDTALITGTGFEPIAVYTLTISSADEPATSTTVEVTADENGEIFYAYQLDGIYRPNYSVVAQDSDGNNVATITFTDSDTISTLPFSDSFGTTNQTNFPGWDDNNADITSGSGDDTSRGGSATVKFAKIDDDEWICKTFNSTGFTNLQLGYYWRGDTDAENNEDYGVIEYRIGGNCTDGSGWTAITQHELDNNNQNSSSWSSQQIHGLNSALNNTTFKLRFRTNATSSEESFRIDDVSITGSVLAQPDLVVVKTNNVGGNATLDTPFAWTITVTNNGLGTATFTNNEDVLQDNLPDSDDFDYSPTSNISVSTSGGITGGFDCDIDNGDDLDCDADGTLTIPAGASFNLSITSTPTSTGTFSNPRSGGNNKCQVDPDGLKAETNEDNNNCVDSVEVTKAPTISNPTLPQACGIDVGLIIDTSTSIDNTELGQMRTAFSNFVGAFIGTPTQVAVVSFDDSAVVQSGFTSDLPAVQSIIAGVDGSGFTNWEDALNDMQALLPNRADKPDLIIFTSDGDPTDSDGPLSDLQDAVVKADAIKAAGIRIVTLGIGGAVNQSNLEAISSADAYYSAANFTALQTAIEELVTDLCGGTVTARKLIDQTPAQGWTFTINGNPYVTDANGYTQAVEVPPSTYAISETQQNGYSMTSAICTGATNNGTQGVNSVSGVQVGSSDVVACTFTNTLNAFCGDGITNGNEQCDNGASNGNVCSPDYGNSCNYCSSQCTTVTVNGPFCGDGIVNGSETCDGTAGVPNASFSCNAQCSLDLVDPDIDICHSTGSNGNPYITNSPSKSGDVSGHNDHNGPVWFPGIAVEWGDIIPPFDYIGGSYPGKNWDATGQAIWNNQCNMPDGTLIVKKVVVGSTDPATNFSFSVNGDDAISFEADAQNDLTVDPGIYTITESAVTGYTTTYDNCTEVSLKSGETETCTITNTRDVGSVKVNKLADTDGNGSYETSNSETFTWTLDGSGTNTMGATVNDIVTGNHSVGETLASGYTFTGWFESHSTQFTCANPQGATLPVSVSVAKDQTTEITLCNKLDVGHLIVEKTTNPTGDQTSFTITASGTGTIVGSSAGSISDSTDYDYTVTPGTYSVSEDVPTGWTQISNTCNSISVVTGETKTCTITNGKLPTLTVVKAVTNDDGGLKEVEDFTLQINGNAVTSGAMNMLPPGSYTVSEIADPDYLGAITGDCAADGATTLSYGDTKTCTITNDDIPATLIVKKVVVGSNDPVTNFDFLINNAGQQTFEADGQNDLTVDAGTYTVTEVVETGYTSTYDNCTNLVLGNGDTATCTITNTRDTGAVTFEKIVVGGSALPSEWLFTVSGDNGSFTSGQSTVLPTGSYTVTESGAVDYSATSASGVCSGLQGNTATLTVTKDGGTCTFTNTRDTGSVKVNKRTDANGDGDFNDSGEGVNGTASNIFNWSLDEVGNNVMGATVSEVITGNHNVGENTATNYHFVGWFTTNNTQYSCMNPEGTTLPAVVGITKGQTSEITLCNARDVGSIVIVKDAINNDGQDFSFTTAGGLSPSSFILDDDGNNNNTRSNTRVYGAAVTGQYTITENNTSGWRLTNLVCNDNNGLINLNNRQAVINVETGETVTCTFTNTELGSVVGTKYNDQNGDNDKDFLEPNLNGWTIFIDANENSVLDNDEVSTTTSGWFIVNLGVYSFNNVLPGTYRICEVPQNGWTSSLPDGAVCQETTLSPGENEILRFGNHEPLTVNAYKIVCQTEADLPNWGENAPNITASTAQNFVNNSQGQCELVEGWDFQFGYDGQVTKYGNGDQLGSAPSPWQTLGTTNASGVAQIIMNELDNNNGIWVREVLKENYVPFSYPTAGPTENPYSAEIYCATDGENYDNFDQIDAPLFGSTYSCVAFNALNTGTITIDKVTDPEGSNESFDFILVKGETEVGQQSLSDGTEPYTFEDLIVGEYTLTESAEEGWDLMSVTCTGEEVMENGGTITVSPNEDVVCTFNNQQRGSLDVTKYNDINGNGQKDENEDVLSGWEINISGEESQKTGEDGEVTFGNLIPGEYELSETLQENWLQTNISCDSNERQVEVDENVEQGYTAYVYPGQVTSCEIGNQASPTLTIEKSNNALVTKAPGDEVIFTLKLVVQGSNVNGLIATDLPAKGFTVQPGSLTVTKNGLPFPVSMLHNYASPGKWDLGDSIVGDEYVLSYTATIASDQESGLYNDLAWAEGDNESWGDVLAQGQNSEYTSENFVGTSVPVGVNPNPSTQFGSTSGSVLGASTELPATGANTLWLFISMGLITTGFSLRKVSREFEK